MRPSDTIMEAVRTVRAQAAPLDLRDRNILLANLQFFYQVMVASEDLLKDALAHQASQSLSAYFETHLSEERGHALWLAEDLAGAGIDVAAMPRSRTAIAMAGSQYYMVKHASTASLLGYMLTLECFPMPLDFLSELERLHGKELLRTVRHHAENDTGHGADLLAIIDQNYSVDVLHSAIETARYINEFAQELQ